MQHIPGLFIAESLSRGKGVFTAQEVSIGDVIEICPVILIPENQLALIDKTILYHYYFLWPDEKGSACMALGYGSIYNHASKPNASVTFDLSYFTIIITSLMAISPGEEIFIDYQGGIKNAPDLWFDVL